MRVYAEAGKARAFLASFIQRSFQTMSSALSLVSHKYAAEKHLPSVGEIILLRLSDNLFGPGSSIENTRSLPSGANRHNYHYSIVMGVSLRMVPELLVLFTVLPMPAYSFTDPVSGLSSTRWLLDQAEDFQRLHIPVPYEQASTTMESHPPFPTPAGFGDPLQTGGWKHNRPIWVQVMPQVAALKYTTTFKCFDPPVKLSNDELGRLKEFCPPLDIYSSITFPSSFPQGGNAAPAKEPDVSPPSDGASLGSSSLPVGHLAGRSLAVQALYANNGVKYALFRQLGVKCYTDDDDDDDDDEDWEDNMEPMTFVRFYAPGNPLLMKMVEDYDRKNRERLNEGIANWAKGLQSGHSEFSAS